MFKNKNKQFLKKIIIKSISCNCISCNNFFFFFEQVYLCVDLSVWMCLCVGVFVCIWGKRRRWEVTKFVEPREKREKKRSEREISKIINRRATVTMYIYMVTVTCVEIYTFLHNLKTLTWKIFGVKCVKMVVFCILQRFTRAGVDALRSKKIS